MRPIIFRGKTYDGEWVYGLLTIMWGQYHIIDSDDENIAYPVDSATIGQYTGLTDKNNKEIFEGDIVHCRGGEFFQGYHEIDEEVIVKDITDGICVYLGEVEDLEIVGNIYDNLEMIESEVNSD